MAIANGILRDTVLVRIMSLSSARRCSGVILSIVVFAWTLVTFRWIGSPSPLACAAIGALWALLTVVFEFSFGRMVAKKSWEEVLRPYRLEGGDLWVFVLATVAFSPIVVSLIRRHA